MTIICHLPIAAGRGLASTRRGEWRLLVDLGRHDDPPVTALWILSGNDKEWRRGASP